MAHALSVPRPDSSGRMLRGGSKLTASRAAGLDLEIKSKLVMVEPSVSDPFLVLEASGRGEGCAVMLDSRSVSRLHALIQPKDAGDLSLSFEDLREFLRPHGE